MEHIGKSNRDRQSVSINLSQTNLCQCEAIGYLLLGKIDVYW